MSLGVGEWFFIVISGLLILFAVVSNFLVILVVIRIPKMRNVTNMFICNLAISDIILAGVILPQHLHDLSHDDEYHEGEFLCKLVNAVPILCISGSIYTMTAVSFERKRSIIHSLQTQITLQTCKFIVPAIWVLAVASCMPSLIEFSVSTVNGINGTEFTSCGSHKVSKTFSIANGVCLLLVTYILPLCLIWYNYFAIIRFVIQRTNKTNPKGVYAQELKMAEVKSAQRQMGKSGKQTSMQLLEVPKECPLPFSKSQFPTDTVTVPNPEENEIVTLTQENRDSKKSSHNLPVPNTFASVMHKKKMNIIKMLIIVAALFALCWSPYFVTLLTAKIQGTDDSEDIKGGLSLLKLSLAIISTAYNVIIYVIFNSNFRVALKEYIFRCKKVSKISLSGRPSTMVTEAC